jgi:hypothetical protein
MSARRLGRLLGSVLMLAALVGGIFVGDLGSGDASVNDSWDWTGYFGQVTVDSPVPGTLELLAGER